METKTLLISGNTLQEWNIEEILTDETTKTIKDIYSELLYECEVYRKGRKEMYETFHLSERLQK